MNTEPITLTESKRLNDLEHIISVGRDYFKSAGEALIEIRDNRLYRSEFGSFEDYCQAKWGWTRRRAYQLIDASTIIRSLPAKCEPLVHTERQARELAKTPEPQREAVIQSASDRAEADGREMTAADVKTARLELCEDEPEPPRVHSADEDEADPREDVGQETGIRNASNRTQLAIERLDRVGHGKEVLAGIAAELTVCAHLFKKLSQ